MTLPISTKSTDTRGRRRVLRTLPKCALVAGLLFYLACSGESKVRSDDDDDAGGGAAGGGPSADACEQYISCVAAAQPSMVGDAIGVYGSEGSCWKELPEAECLNACETGTSQLAADHPEVGACNPDGGPSRLNLYILVDKSTSMDENAKWEDTTLAFTSFFQNANAGELDVALRFWPDEGCEDFDPDDMNDNDTTCSITPCATPQVPLGPLSEDDHQQALIELFLSKFPAGATPMSAALEGGIAWGQTTKASESNDATAIILVTDGVPNGCIEDHAVIQEIAANAFSIHGIRVFAVGLDGASETLMNGIASAGGTGTAFVIGSDNGEQELLAALLEIAGGTP